jgi:hypothetical protein
MLPHCPLLPLVQRRPHSLLLGPQQVTELPSGQQQLLLSLHLVVPTALLRLHLHLQAPAA